MKVKSLLFAAFAALSMTAFADGTAEQDGVVIDRVGVVANEDVARLNLFDAIGEIAKNWSTAK